MPESSIGTGVVLAACTSPIPVLRVDTPERLATAWLASFSAPNTRAAYRRDLLHFERWLEEHAPGADLDQVTRPVVDLYARGCEAAGERPSTIARRLTALASLYRYAQSIDALPTNPVTHVKRPKVSGEGVTPGLDRDQADRLLTAAEAAGPRDGLLVALLLLNGLRVSEALALDVSDVDTVSGHTTVVVRGKGGTENRVPLPPRTVALLTAAVGGRTAGPLLLDTAGARFDRHDATRALRRLARTAGLDPAKVSPHVLRVAAVTAALDAGVPLRDVQDFARHADPRTTRRYDRGRNSLDRHASYAVAAFLATRTP